MAALRDSREDSHGAMYARLSAQRKRILAVISMRCARQTWHTGLGIPPRDYARRFAGGKRMGKRILIVIFAAVLLSSCHSATTPTQSAAGPDETPLRKIPQTF